MAIATRHIEARGLAFAVSTLVKKMLPNFISKDGYGITPACRRYLEPLIRGESPPPFGANGLPKYVAHHYSMVPQRLPPFHA